MGVLKRRNRLISFRLSDDEYQSLLQSTAAKGARSISDFSRTALCRALNENLNPSNAQTEEPFSSHVRELIKSMQELGNVITKLSGQIEGASSGVTRSPVKT